MPRSAKPCSEEVYKNCLIFLVGSPFPEFETMWTSRISPQSIAAATVLIFTLSLPFASAKDTLEAGGVLSSNETLVSPEGSFVLGFFRRRGDSLYLGIWYRRDPLQTVVWVANRLSPIPGGAGSLLLSAAGGLRLIDTAQKVYWSSPAAATKEAFTARLLDNGNLVILNGSMAGQNNYSWESFSQPSDTLLPGMRIGINLLSQETFTLRPWRSYDDPSPSDFSFLVDIHGVPQLMVKNGSDVVWRGGPWAGDRFSGIPAMKGNIFFDYGFLSASDGIYFRLQAWDQSRPTRLTLNQSGIAEHLQWNPVKKEWDVLWTSALDICDAYDMCGVNSLCDAGSSPPCSCPEGFVKRNTPEKGCERKEPLKCGEREDFVAVAGVKLPDTTMATANWSIGFDECRKICMENCSCTAFTSSDGTGCISWFGDLVDVRVYKATEGQELYLRVYSGEDEQSRLKATTVVAVCLALVVALFVVLWCVLRRRPRRIHLSGMAFTEHGIDGEKEFDIPIFQLDTIIGATDNFSFQNKLGEGGFGPVYRGELGSGLTIAAKRLSSNPGGQGQEEFMSEIKLLVNLQHTNLVKLLGCCITESEKILIYEYMPNQSLDRLVFDPKKGVELDWIKRTEIIVGIAQGLLYLHSYSRVRAIHRDLKASNILLDSDWKPKISDFGMARICTLSDEPWKTKRIVGTYGYIPPEYATRGLFSVKSDVFGYGILLLEILTGKRNTSIIETDESLYLSGHVWNLWKTGRELELMDPTLSSRCPPDGFSRYVHIGLLCVQANAVDRPSMIEVVSMLLNESLSLPVPNKPAYFSERLLLSEESLTKSSLNEATCSEVFPR